MEDTHVLFTAHSIPISMAKGCSYENQLNQLAESLSARIGLRNWKLTFQSPLWFTVRTLARARRK